MGSMRQKRARYIEEEDLSQELIENTAEETETLESSEEKDVITRESQYFEENTANYLAQNLGTTQNEVYNPNQDKEEVLEIRRTYAQLREELSRCGRELVQADSNKLSELIDQANVIFSKVHTTSDASLDSRFITDTADLGVEKVQKLPLLVSEFSLDSYLRIVKNFMIGSSWDSVGSLLSQYWIGVDTCDFMLGPLEIEVKRRNPTLSQVSRSAPNESKPVVKPTVVNIAGRSENAELSKETSENVMKVFAALEKIGSFPFYHFITDPNSFARTVENLFYVSFLIRDNRARIFIPEMASSTNELYIEAIVDEDDSGESGGELNQMVMGMTFKVWRQSVEKYKIQNSFLVFE